MAAAELTIGTLAEAAGVNIETIRYYQRRGLLDEPSKPLGGHRRYAPEQAKRGRFIKRAQALGYSALALTDECSVAGVVRAHAEARRLGLKLLPGAHFVLPGATFVVLPRSLLGWGQLPSLYWHWSWIPWLPPGCCYPFSWFKISSASGRSGTVMMRGPCCSPYPAR